METKYVDFIGMYEGVYPDGYCHHMIEEFERFHREGLCGNRQNSEGVTKLQKQDEFVGLNIKNHTPSSFNGECSLRIFFEGLQRCFDEYVNEFDVLKEPSLKCSSVKMQKTMPGGGYHVWHPEQGNGDHASRGLVYSLYLNTLEPDAAGETEFLYQRCRIPPKENCMVIWPAAFTHTHRGNTVHGHHPKYIITGWFYYD